MFTHGSVNFHAIVLIFSVLPCGVVFVDAFDLCIFVFFFFSFFFFLLLFKSFVLRFVLIFLVGFFPSFFFFLGHIQMMFHSFVSFAMKSFSYSQSDFM